MTWDVSRANLLHAFTPTFCSETDVYADSVYLHHLHWIY